MTKRAIYLTNGSGPDTAIEKGLQEAGCEVRCTHSIGETLQKLREEVVNNPGKQPGKSGGGRFSSKATGAGLCSESPILVANVGAGAIPLLTLLSEQGVDLPPTLIYDEDGNDIHNIIRALQLGVREYVLASDPEGQRQLSARVLAERVISQNVEEAVEEAPASPAALTTQAQPQDFEWDAIGRVIHVGDSYLRLSPVEGRIFDLLLSNRDRTVSIDELAEYVLSKADLKANAGARRLRPHVMRLRRKLERYPALANRIVNMRGTGYMLV
jgi:DNA-binding response OmpR family regulator